MKVWEGYLRGVNFGGWLSQFGTYREDHFASFITEADFAAVKKMGFDHVRIPVDFILLESNDEKAARNPLGYMYLHRSVEYCRKYGLHMIIGLHEAYGYSFDPLKDMDRERFFYDEALQRRFRDLWCCIAREFYTDQDIVAFELLNEVVLSTVYEAWNHVAAETISEIRAIAPDTWIVLGGVRYNNVNAVRLLGAPADDHIVYNFHCYEPLVFTHQGAYWVKDMPSDFRMPYPDTVENYRKESRILSPELAGGIYDEAVTEIGPAYFMNIFRPAVEAAETYSVPLYCGEYGVIDLAAPEYTLNWLRDIHKAFTHYGIGRAVWNYKEKDFGIIDARLDAVRDELEAYF